MTKIDTRSVKAYYDSYGKRYHDLRITEGKLFNEYIETPTVLSLLEELSNVSSILDVGCGSGIYAKKLHEAGYQVMGIDSSEEMIEIAKDYCKNLNIEFTLSPIERFETNKKFDIALGSFLLGYFKDLTILFGNMKKFLRPKGKVIVSGIHPIRTSVKTKNSEGYFIDNYFNTSFYQTFLLPNEKSVSIAHHTISDISKAIYDAGFVIEKIFEPTPFIKNEDYKGYRDYSFHTRNPSVIVFLLSIRD